MHFYNALAHDPLGGLVQNGSVTEANFLDMLIGILLVTNAPIRVQERTSGHHVTRTNNQLQPGHYDIYGDGRCSQNVCFNPLVTFKIDRIEVTDEPWIHRVISFNVSGRNNSFRQGIRTRDGRCVVTGIVNRAAVWDDWGLFEAAHIFPLEKESLWIEGGYGQWITDMDDTTGISKINSCQNGFLIRADLHNLFDQYLWSVNPDVSNDSRPEYFS